jgi:Na+/H+-dicarboxylate symporter
MRVLIKLLIGTALGLALAYFAPENQRFMDALIWLEQFVLQVGRYVLIPVLVFSLTVSVYELKKDGQFWPLIFKNLFLIAGVSLFVISAGIFITLVFPPARIPILAEEQIEIIRLNITGNIKDLFPYNMFSVFAGDGVYLLPVCLFAFILGMGLTYDKSYSKPVIALTDSFSRIFFFISTFFIEILGFTIIVLSSYWTIRFREVLQAGIFFELILLLGIIAAVLCLGIFPLFLYFLKPRVNPWKVLFGSLGTGIAGFFSGDINFSLPVLIWHAKENLGIKRRSNMISLTLFSTFCRAGSAMVAAVAFIVIFKSYSSLGIAYSEVLAIGLRVFGISFLLAGHPCDGAYTALAVLCLGYGQGFEAGYLILKPMIFYLIAVGTFIDVMIASFAAYTIAYTNGFVEDKSAKRFDARRLA